LKLSCSALDRRYIRVQFLEYRCVHAENSIDANLCGGDRLRICIVLAKRKTPKTSIANKFRGKPFLLQPHNHPLPVPPFIVLSTLFMQRAYTRPPSSSASLLRNPKPRPPKKTQTFQHYQNLQLQRAGRAKGSLHPKMRTFGETGSRTQNLLHSTCTLLYDAKKMSYR
jgi:hypothetical protein